MMDAPSCAAVPIRRHKGITDQEFYQAYPAIQRAASIAAKKIRRHLTYVDDEDLVQEAMEAVYRNRGAYDPCKSSIHTWSVCVARNKIYSIARELGAGINGKTFLVDHTQLPKGCEMGVVGNTTISQDELIEKREALSIARAMMHDTARQIFDLLINPPDDLVEKVKQDRNNQLRRWHNGRRGRRPNKTYVISNCILASYLGISDRAVKTAKHNMQSVASEFVN